MTLSSVASKEFEGEIPVLDVNDYLAGKPGALEDLAEQLAWASEHVGFYFLRCPTDVAAGFRPLALVPEVLEMDRKLHRLPEHKLRSIAIDNNSGYQFGSNDGATDEDGAADVRGDDLEAVKAFEAGRAQAFDKGAYGAQGTYRLYAASKGHGRTWAQNQFPAEEDLPGFREVTEAYATALGTLASQLLPVYARALGMAAAELLVWFEDPKQNLALNYFVPRPAEHLRDWNGVAMHGDVDFFTVVAQDGAPGLQIMLETGEWVGVPAPPPGCVLVNTGEFLSRLTNHGWRNTVHKVVPPHDRERYTLAFFFSQDKLKELAPLPQFCAPEAPALYAPFSYLSVLRAGVTPFTVGARERRKRRGEEQQHERPSRL